MARVLRRPAAVADLLAIHAYIADDAPVRAGDFLRTLDRKIRMLAATPHIGTARLPAFPRVRMFPVGRYLILYQPLEHEDGIELIRIIHGARDWQTLILDDLP